jgi:hypothetical protein
MIKIGKSKQKKRGDHYELFDKNIYIRTIFDYVSSRRKGWGLEDMTLLRTITIRQNIRKKIG